MLFKILKLFLYQTFLGSGSKVSVGLKRLYTKVNDGTADLNGLVESRYQHGPVLNKDEGTEFREVVF